MQISICKHSVLESFKLNVLIIMTHCQTVLSTERLGTTTECINICWGFFSPISQPWQDKLQEQAETGPSCLASNNNWIGLVSDMQQCPNISCQKGKRSEMRHFWSSLSHSRPALSSDAGYVSVACSEQQEWATCQSPPPHTTLALSQSERKCSRMYFIEPVCFLFLFFFNRSHFLVVCANK